MSGKISIEELDENLKSKLNNGGSKNASEIILEDSENVFESTNVEDALKENKISILELQEEVNGQRIRGIEIINSLINKL